MVKPFKGYMENYCKQEFKDGYIYRGRFLNHPDFGFTSSNASTSQVLKEKVRSDGSIEIETLNSRYILISDRSQLPRHLDYN